MAPGAAAPAHRAKPSTGGSGRRQRGSWHGVGAFWRCPSDAFRRGMWAWGDVGMGGSVPLCCARGTPGLGRAPSAGTAAHGAALSLFHPIPSTSPSEPLPTSARHRTGAATTSSWLASASHPSGTIGPITAPTARIWGLPGRARITGCSGAHTERQLRQSSRPCGAAGTPAPEQQGGRTDPTHSTPIAAPRAAAPMQRPEHPP